MLDISLTGLRKTVGVAATPMINARNGGSIVIISSIARLTGSEQFNGLWKRNASRLRKLTGAREANFLPSTCSEEMTRMWIVERNDNNYRSPWSTHRDARHYISCLGHASQIRRNSFRVYLPSGDYLTATIVRG
jgi:NAD(P)-dependent dehydrogenase (short-subunit alcohol dehydrogenase family)